jgi:hypothetical protein
MKRKKATSRESEEPQLYLIRVRSVAVDYSFGVNGLFRKDELFQEFCHPKVIGCLIRPELQDVAAVEITLIGNRDLARSSQTTRASYANGKGPEAIGFIAVHDGKLEGVISVPFDALSVLQPALVANQIEVISLNGKKLKYRQARIRSVSFTARYIPEDYD